MLATALAAVAMTVAIVGVGMLGTLVVQMVVVVRMLVAMLMAVGMLVGMGHTVVGVLMGMGMRMLVVMAVTADMIVMQMHKKVSFAFFLYYTD
jgi:hypothetical protein